MFTCQAGNSTTIVDISHHKKTYEYVFFLRRSNKLQSKAKENVHSVRIERPPTDGINFQSKENPTEKGANRARVGQRSLLSTLLPEKETRKTKRPQTLSLQNRVGD